MAAPATTARLNPSSAPTNGIAFEDGYQALLAFNINPSVKIWEKTVKPPGMDGGDAIETSTMHNTTWRTFAPRSLKTLTEMTIKGAYDPDVKNDILLLINVRGSITLTYPDGSTEDFYGYLRVADFDELVEGTHPEGTFTIQPTNWDPVNRVEAAPVLTEVAGT